MCAQTHATVPLCGLKLVTFPGPAPLVLASAIIPAFLCLLCLGLGTAGLGGGGLRHCGCCCDLGSHAAARPLGSWAMAAGEQVCFAFHPYCGLRSSNPWEPGP